MTQARRLSFVVDERHARERVDRAAADHFADAELSRSRVSVLCADGRVRVDGRVAKASQRLVAGQKVDLEVPAIARASIEAEDIPIRVVYEDSHLLVVDKPAGLVVHPSRGHASGTLVNALRFHSDSLDSGSDALRPGIVHRIDKDTSGLLVVARSAAARAGLEAMFKRHEIERTYLAVVVGRWAEPRTFTTLHGRHPVDRKRFTSRVTRGRRAVTHVRPMEAFGTLATLVECTLETGRTHQIRMHVSEGGHPIIGDVLYGRVPRDPGLRNLAERLGRQALHARTLGFLHPVSGKRLRFESEIPGDIASLLDSLRARVRALSGS